MAAAVAPTVTVTGPTEVEQGSTGNIYTATVTGGTYDEITYSWSASTDQFGVFPRTADPTTAEITVAPAASLVERSVTCSVEVSGTGTNADEDTTDTASDSIDVDVVEAEEPVDPGGWSPAPPGGLVLTFVKPGTIPSGETGTISVSLQDTISDGDVEYISNVDWSIEGGGSISSSGVITAPETNTALTLTITADVTIKRQRTFLRDPTIGTYSNSTTVGVSGDTSGDVLPLPVSPGITLSGPARIRQGQSGDFSVTVRPGTYDEIASISWTRVSGTGGGSFTDASGPSARYEVGENDATGNVTARCTVTVRGTGTNARTGETATTRGTHIFIVDVADAEPVITTHRETIYILASSKPSAPTSVQEINDVPSGWSNGILTVTSTEDLWAADRNVELHDNVFDSATNWIVRDNPVTERTNGGPTVTRVIENIFTASATQPSAPTSAASVGDVPTGWTSKPGTPTETLAIWEATRTVTLHDNAYHSATAWTVNSTPVADATGPILPLPTAPSVSILGPSSIPQGEIGIFLVGISGGTYGSISSISWSKVSGSGGGSFTTSTGASGTYTVGENAALGTVNIRCTVNVIGDGDETRAGTTARSTSTDSFEVIEKAVETTPLTGSVNLTQPVAGGTTVGYSWSISGDDNADYSISFSYIGDINTSSSTTSRSGTLNSSGSASGTGGAVSNTSFVEGERVTVRMFEGSSLIDSDSRTVPTADTPTPTPTPTPGVPTPTPTRLLSVVAPTTIQVTGPENIQLGSQGLFTVSYSGGSADSYSVSWERVSGDGGGSFTVASGEQATFLVGSLADTGSVTIRATVTAKGTGSRHRTGTVSRSSTYTFDVVGVLPPITAPSSISINGPLVVPRGTTATFSRVLVGGSYDEETIQWSRSGSGGGSYSVQTGADARFDVPDNAALGPVTITVRSSFVGDNVSFARGSTADLSASITIQITSTAPPPPKPVVLPDVSPPTSITISGPTTVQRGKSIFLTRAITGNTWDEENTSWDRVSGEGGGFFTDRSGATAIFDVPLSGSLGSVRLRSTSNVEGTGVSFRDKSTASVTATHDITVTDDPVPPPPPTVLPDVVAPSVTITAPSEVQRGRSITLNTVVVGAEYDAIRTNWRKNPTGGGAGGGSFTDSSGGTSSYLANNDAALGVVHVQAVVNVEGTGAEYRDKSAAVVVAEASFTVIEFEEEAVDPLPDVSAPTSVSISGPGAVERGSSIRLSRSLLPKTPTWDVTRSFWDRTTGSVGGGSFIDSAGEHALYQVPDTALLGKVVVRCVVDVEGDGTLYRDKSAGTAVGTYEIEVKPRTFVDELDPATAPTSVSISGPDTVKRGSTASFTRTFSGGEGDTHNTRWEKTTGQGGGEFTDDQGQTALYYVPDDAPLGQATIQATVTRRGDGFSYSNGSTASLSATKNIEILKILLPTEAGNLALSDGNQVPLNSELGLVVSTSGNEDKYDDLDYSATITGVDGVSVASVGPDITITSGSTSGNAVLTVTGRFSGHGVNSRENTFTTASISRVIGIGQEPTGAIPGTLALSEGNQVDINSMLDLRATTTDGNFDAVVYTAALEDAPVGTSVAVVQQDIVRITSGDMFGETKLTVTASYTNTGQTTPPATSVTERNITVGDIVIGIPVEGNITFDSVEMSGEVGVFSGIPVEGRISFSGLYGTARVDVFSGVRVEGELTLDRVSITGRVGVDSLPGGSAAVIDGITYAIRVGPKSLEINRRLRSRGEMICSLSLESPLDLTVLPQPRHGQSIRYVRNGNVLFSGFIARSKTDTIENKDRFYDITAYDAIVAFKWAIFKQKWTDKTLREILISALQHPDIARRGVTLHPDQTNIGVVSGDFIAYNLPGDDLLRALADKTDSIFYADEQNRIRFVRRGDVAAEFNLTDSGDNHIGSVDQSIVEKDYANYVLVKAPSYESESRTVDFYGNGVDREFQILNRYTGEPDPLWNIDFLQINGYRIEIGSEDSGAPFTWTRGSSIIKQRTGPKGDVKAFKLPLDSTDLVYIQYTSMIHVAEAAVDEDEIALRGRISKVLDISGVTKEEAAEQARRTLELSRTVRDSLTYRTLNDTVRPAQNQFVRLTTPAAVGSYIVTRASYYDRSGTLLEGQIELSNTLYPDSIEAFKQDQALSGDVVRVDESGFSRIDIPIEIHDAPKRPQPPTKIRINPVIDRSAGQSDRIFVTFEGGLYDELDAEFDVTGEGGTFSDIFVDETTAIATFTRTDEVSADTEIRIFVTLRAKGTGVVASAGREATATISTTTTILALPRATLPQITFRAVPNGDEGTTETLRVDVQGGIYDTIEYEWEADDGSIT